MTISISASNPITIEMKKTVTNINWCEINESPVINEHIRVDNPMNKLIIISTQPIALIIPLDSFSLSYVFCVIIHKNESKGRNQWTL
jgi:hypothetical protein